MALPPRPLRIPADLLLAVLPPESSRADTVDRVGALLNEVAAGGRLLVIGPRDALIGDLADDASTARRRAALLHSNALEVVVDLPRSAHRGPSGRASAALVIRRSA